MQKLLEERLERESDEALEKENGFLSVPERAQHALTMVETLGKNLDVILAKAKEETSSSPSNMIPQSVATVRQQRIQLSRLEMAKFSGEPLQWPSFCAQFKAIVDEQGLQKIQKLLY